MKPTHNMMQVRRARERTACRLDMLEAAERIFAAKGYDAATVEAIAHEAGCAAGTLYNFFAGKKELFLAVADRILDDMIARFDTEVAPLQNEPQRAIRVYIALRFDEISRHEAFMHVFVPHGRTHCAARKPGAGANSSKFETHIASVQALFAAAIAQGVLRPVVTPSDYTGIIEGALRFFHKLWQRETTPPSLAEALQRLDKVLLPLLWHEDFTR